MKKQPKNLLSNHGTSPRETDETVDNKGLVNQEANINTNVNDNDNINVNDDINKDVNSNVNVNKNDNKNVMETHNKNEHELDNKKEEHLDSEEHPKDDDESDSLVDNIRVSDPKRKYKKPKTVLDVLVDQKKTKKQMGFYLDHDVSEAVDRLNSLGKGRIKSTFVNEVLREALEREGLL